MTTNSKKRKFKDDEWLKNIENEVAIIKKNDHVSILPYS